MGRKGPKPRPLLPTKDPKSLRSLAVKHLGWMKLRGFSPHTITARESQLKSFLSWCDSLDMDAPEDLTRAVLVQYQRFLFHERTRRGERRSTWDQCNRLTTLRCFTRWLVKNGHLALDPAADLEMPRLGERLPRGLFSAAEVESVLSQPNVKGSLGLRDRAVLEVLYSTGLRRSEAAALRISDVDFERETVMVREGKGGRDRVVPIGSRAMTWLEKYLRDVRPRFVGAKDDGTVFLTCTGERIHPCQLGAIVKGYVGDAGIERRGSCHLFRHAMATLMLENGADVRYVQEMLGHKRLSTTQVYTHVSIGRLKEVHTKTHPGALLKKRS